MEIKFANKNIESFFTDVNYMSLFLSTDVVKKIIKRLFELESFVKINDLFETGIGNPFYLDEGINKVISWNVDKKYRLILEIDDSNDHVLIKGVTDNYDIKNNWIIV